MSLWSLQYKGEKKTLREWGVNRVRRNRVSQGIDTVQFNQPVLDMLADQQFAEGEIIEIFREEERWFYGRVEDAARSKAGRTAVMNYTVSGPWWWLENMGFRQHWKIKPDLTKPDLIDQFNSYVLLGTKVDGTLQTLGDQIAEALQYAIDQGAPLSFDLNKKDSASSLPAIFPPVRDVWNAPVADVVRKMIEWCPDIVTWFDYAATPFPKLHLRRRADQDAALVDLFDEKLIAECSVKARNDRKVPGVIIYYITTDSENGQVYSVINEDKYPAETTGREPKALLAAINLEGSQTTYAQAAIECIPIAAASADWWKLHRPELQSESIQNLTIDPAISFVDENGDAVVPLPNELIGQWAPWMGGNAIPLTVKALASYEEHLNGEPIHTVSKREIFVSITSTNLVTGVYRSTPGGTPAEAQPVGLAQELYKAAGELHFDGRVVVKEAACSDKIPLGSVLNLKSGRPEWETMRAQVQTVSEDIDTGATTVTFGPPKQLGPDDYIELLRATRNRFRWAAPSARATGITGGSSAILGQTFPKQVPASNLGGITQQTWIDPTKTLPGSVSINLAVVNGKHVMLREITICDNGVEKKMIVLASEIY
jgi:hypothetical protein